MKRVVGRIFLALLACSLLTQCQSPQSSRFSDRRAPVLLAIFAHPDDEASVGPVLAKYAASGAQVYLAVATDGRLGVSQHASIPEGDPLVVVREQELRCAADKLGLQAPITFGMHDQLRMSEGLQTYMAQMRELHERVRKLFEDLQPDAVITWGPSGWTGHPDHRIVSAVVTEVFQSRQWERPAQLYYPALPTAKTPTPAPFPVVTVEERFLNRRIKLEPRDYEKAKESWLCHRSQYTPEQIEQMHQSLLSTQQGVAHFQALLPGGTSDSLLPN